MRCFYVPLVALCITGAFVGLTVGADATEPASSDGETAAIERLYRVEFLPRLAPSGETAGMFSSYDRTGGNNDGFEGTYSKLRVENGNSILAEMTGAGCIERIHFPFSAHREPALLNHKGEHIRIFLDGEKTPALDVPLEDLFHGKIDGFPKPLVGEGTGAFYCYVPISYRNGCKVEVDGTDVRFYTIQYRTYPSGKGIVSFHNPPTQKQREALTAAVKAWNSCGDLAALGVNGAERLETPIDLKTGQTLDVELPPGARMVLAVYFTADSDTLKDVGKTRLEMRWDGAAKSAVDLPLDFLFCQAMRTEPFRSLLVGTSEHGWYNHMPMPYAKSGRVTLKAERPLTGRLTIVTAPMDEWRGDQGYFHAVYHESLPTKLGKFHPWVSREGRGHYVGTYLVTDGKHPSKLPVWLEGDEWFTCDGELRIHGTGTEDYFNCGWYAVPGRLNGPCAYPLHGFSVYRKEDGRDLAAAFRWHVPDAVPYEKSIEAKIEHGGTNDVNANYRSAAFFYDAAP
ncbi:MAG TPA: glycoside hydrolase family 172 protein [Thermoguttaceae bacterium]|nr:glycoside hydrolase family 172 protein [Thermoguttaceae bacterium]